MRKEIEQQIDGAIDRAETRIRASLASDTEAAQRSRENVDRYTVVRRDVILPCVTEFMQKIRSRNWKARTHPEGLERVEPRAETIVVIVSPPGRSHLRPTSPLVIEFRLDPSENAVACFDGPDRKLFEDDTPTKCLPMDVVSWDRIEEYLAEAFVRYAG